MTLSTAIYTDYLVHFHYLHIIHTVTFRTESFNLGVSHVIFRPPIPILVFHLLKISFASSSYLTVSPKLTVKSSSYGPFLFTFFVASSITLINSSRFPSDEQRTPIPISVCSNVPICSANHCMFDLPFGCSGSSGLRSVRQTNLLGTWLNAFPKSAIAWYSGHHYLSRIFLTIKMSSVVDSPGLKQNCRLSAIMSLPSLNLQHLRDVFPIALPFPFNFLHADKYHFIYVPMQQLHLIILWFAENVSHWHHAGNLTKLWRHDHESGMWRCSW